MIFLLWMHAWLIALIQSITSISTLSIAIHFLSCTSATATTSSLGRSNQLISLAWITTLPAMFFWQPNLTQTYATSCSFQVAGVLSVFGVDHYVTMEHLARSEVVIGTESPRYFGLVPIFGLGNIFMVPVGTCASMLFAPPLVSRSYPFKVGPSAILFPIVGFLLVPWCRLS